MEEHKFLTGMLLVALVVSVVGTVLTVDRMGSLNLDQAAGLTAAATSEGSAEVEVESDITVGIPTGAGIINFSNGTMYSDESFSYSVFNSSSGNVTGAGGTWENGTPTNITVRNDGNVGFNVTVASNRVAGLGAGSFACTVATDETTDTSCGSGLTNDSEGVMYSYLFIDNEPGSCGLDLNNVETRFNGTGSNSSSQGCGCLKSSDSSDEIAFQLVVGIPNDVSGMKNSTLTFTSSTSGATC